MANGFCPALLSHIGAVIETGDKNKQLFPAGFLRMLLSSYDPTNILNQPYQGGHGKGLSLTYKKRPTSSQVKDAAPDCDNFNQNSKLEYQVPSLQTKSTGFYVEDALIRQYCKDASDFIKFDKVTGKFLLTRETQVMREVYDDFLNYAALLFKEVNKALVTDMSTKFGENITTGNNNAVNFTFDIRSTAMNDGIIKLFNNLRENEIIDGISIVGNGDFTNLELIRSFFNNNTAQGLSKADFMRMLPEIYYDKHTQAIWGDNHIGVFTKGSVALIARNYNQLGFERRLGNSTFFSVPLPIGDLTAVNGNEDKMVIDMQIKEFDCNTTIQDGYNTRTVGPGIQVNLSYNFKLFVAPDVFDASDELAGTNGTLRFKMDGQGACPCPEEA